MAAPTIDQVLAKAFPFRGQPYRFGAELALTGPEVVGPVDCSELVQVACARAGVTSPVCPDGAYYQWRHTINHGTGMSVAEAVRTRGALLFVGDGTGVGRDAITHVAFSLGDGNTFEARGTAWGVGTWPAGSRFDFAGRLPGVNYAAPTPSTPGAPVHAYSKADADFIVTKLYPLVVGRPADAGGAEFWSGVFQTSDPILALANLASAPEAVDNALLAGKLSASVATIVNRLNEIERVLAAAPPAAPAPVPPAPAPPGPAAPPIAREALEAAVADLRRIADAVADVSSII